jgi:hypothetical protein
MLNNDFIALLITFAVALAWLRINDFAAHRGWISNIFPERLSTWALARYSCCVGHSLLEALIPDIWQPWCHWPLQSNSSW